MDFADRLIEAAAAAVAVERDSAIARIRGALAGDGEDTCVGCDAPIAPARKAALPSAERCISCQQRHERTPRGYRRL